MTRQGLQREPRYRYTFDVVDSAGHWGTATVRASDYGWAEALARRKLTTLEGSGLRVGFAVKLLHVTKNKVTEWTL